MPDGRGRGTYVTGIALRHRRHHHEPRRRKKPRPPHAETACLACPRRERLGGLGGGVRLDWQPLSAAAACSSGGGGARYATLSCTAMALGSRADTRGPLVRVRARAFATSKRESSRVSTSSTRCSSGGARGGSSHQTTTSASLLHS